MGVKSYGSLESPRFFDEILRPSPTFQSIRNEIAKDPKQLKELNYILIRRAYRKMQAFHMDMHTEKRRLAIVTADAIATARLEKQSLATEKELAAQRVAVPDPKGFLSRLNKLIDQIIERIFCFFLRIN